MPYGKKSPATMGHSPMQNQNKGYAKQERKDLMQDMPVVKDAMGGRSWMSKHSKSAFQMGHSPLKEEKKPKTIEQKAAESRARGKESFMKAQAEKDKKSGAHTGKMVKVMTSKGIQEVDSRSQAARDLPIVS